MRQLRISLVLLLLAGACCTLWAEGLDQEAQRELALRELENARSAVFHARLRRAELNIERRSTEQVPSPTPAVRNPDWDRWNAELRATESRSQRLSEKLAPAHPEILAVESELHAIRDQLEATSEFVNLTPPVQPESKRKDDLDLAQRVQLAQRDVEAAESALARAGENYQTALAFRVEKPSATPDSVDFVAPSGAIPGWVWPVVGGLLALACVRRGRARTDKMPITSAPAAQSVKRLVYSTAPADRGSAPSAVEFRPLKNVGPVLIIPRRRSA